MLKTLATASLLATLLSSLSAPTLADLPSRKRHWDAGGVAWDVAHQRVDRRFHGPNRGWKHQHWNNRRWNNRRWNNRHWNAWQWNRWNWNRGHWNGQRWNRWRGWHYPPYGFRGGHWGPGWGNYRNGALVGSAITFGLANDHSERNYDSRGLITRCYRRERGPDGREQRIELSPSECR